MSNTYWAIKKRERAAANAPTVVDAPQTDETPTAETRTKAQLLEAAEAAGVDVKATDTKAEIAAKLADG